MKKRLLPICLLIAYGAVLVKLMVLKDLPVIHVGGLQLNFGGTHSGPPNLVPFKTIGPYLLGEKGWLIASINILGNIVLLVPAGLLVPLVFDGINWKKSLLVGLGAGLLIETPQAILRVGIFDVDDILLNALGVVLGYWLFGLFAKINFVKQKNIGLAAVVVIIIAAAAVLYVGKIYQRDQQPLAFGPVIRNDQPDSLDQRRYAGVPGPDPCNGTGGTGQVISVGNNRITIKRHDGTSVLISFTEQTLFRNATGALSRSELKIGERVTVVVGEDHGDGVVASAVLVCNDAGALPAK